MLRRVPRPMSGAPKPSKKKIAVTGSPSPATASRSRRAVSYTSSGAGPVKAPKPVAKGFEESMNTNAAYDYIVGRLSKRLPSVLRAQQKGRKGRVFVSNARPSDSYAMQRMKASSTGQAAGRAMARGDMRTAGGLKSIGFDNRNLSRYKAATSGRRRGRLVPSPQNPLKRL